MIKSKLKPTSKYDLIRIGSDYDGGYLVEKKSLDNTEILISFGILDNWEFEMDFIKKSQCIKIFTYDELTSLQFLISRFFKNIIGVPIFKLIKNQLYNFFNIFNFIFFIKNKKVTHNTQLIGLTKNLRKSKIFLN